MALVRRDEVLEKALDTDESAIPRYDFIGEDGTTLYENVRLVLKNNIATPGTPINKVALDEMLAASGVTEGTSTAYTLAQENFALTDGAPVRFRLHAASGAAATLDVGGTGAKPVKTVTAGEMPQAIPEGMWLDAVYSEVADAYILTGGSVSAAQMAAWDARTTTAQAQAIAAEQSKVISVTRITSATSQIDITIPSGYRRYRLIGTGIASTYYDSTDDDAVWTNRLAATAASISAAEVQWDLSVEAYPHYSNYTNGTIAYFLACTTVNSGTFSLDIIRQTATSDNWAGHFVSGGFSEPTTTGCGYCFASFTATGLTKISIISTKEITAGMILLEGLA